MNATPDESGEHERCDCAAPDERALGAGRQMRGANQRKENEEEAGGRERDAGEERVDFEPVEQLFPW